MTELSYSYRIDFQVMRRSGDDEDFKEYAFGSTWECDTVSEAGHFAYSAIQNDEFDITSEEMT